MRVRNGPVFTGVNRPPAPFRNRPMMEMIERPETDGTLNAIRKALEGLPFVQVALVFGSIAEGRENPESDVDLGVASDRPLTSSQRMQVIEAVASKTGRPVDVVDLLSAGGPILQQAITKGKKIVCHDDAIYARALVRMWFDQSDWMPIYRRILEERRRKWIGI